MVKSIPSKGRLNRAVVYLMKMPVHPIVYLCIAISVWHSAITVVNGLVLSESNSLIFLNSEAVNIIIGNLGVLVGISLAVVLRYSMWTTSLVLSYICMFCWTFTAAMLYWNLAWGGAIMSTFYVLVYFYISISCSLHKVYGYAVTKSPRQEFYERQK